MTRSKTKFLGFYITKGASSVKESIIELDEKKLKIEKNIELENSSFTYENSILSILNENNIQEQQNLKSNLDANSGSIISQSLNNTEIIQVENLNSKAIIKKNNDHNNLTHILKDYYSENEFLSLQNIVEPNLNYNSSEINTNIDNNLLISNNITYEFSLESYTWLTRSSKILPNMVGKEFLIHNGKATSKLTINLDMFNFNFGEFSFTRRLGKLHTKKKK